MNAKEAHDRLEYVKAVVGNGQRLFITPSHVNGEKMYSPAVYAEPVKTLDDAASLEPVSCDIPHGADSLQLKKQPHGECNC